MSFNIRDKETGDRLSPQHHHPNVDVRWTERIGPSAVESRRDGTFPKRLEVVTDSIILIRDSGPWMWTSNSEVASELGPLKYISELTEHTNE